MVFESIEDFHRRIDDPAAAVAANDLSTLAELRHRDWKAVWPQSGEVVNSTAADQMITDGYPGGRPTLVPGRMVGSEDRWVTSPMGGALSGGSSIVRV